MMFNKTISFILLFTSSFSAFAGLINAGFESGDLTNWQSSGGVSVTPNIANFATQNYGSIGAVNTFQGDYMAQLSAGTVSASSLASIMGVTESTLEASNGNADATDGSLIYQSTTATAGDTFTFNWNFVEEDYLPFDDWAFYGIQYENQATELFKFASLGSVGPDAGATINGWEALTVNITQTGNYTFYFGIVNVNDTNYDSTLFIDGLTGTGSLSSDIQAVSEPTSLVVWAGALVGLMGFRRKR
mgnify:CR=1 FL=1